MKQWLTVLLITAGIMAATPTVIYAEEMFTEIEEESPTEDFLMEEEASVFDEIIEEADYEDTGATLINGFVTAGN